MDRPNEGHTLKRYDGELDHLHCLVLETGGLVVHQVGEAFGRFQEPRSRIGAKGCRHG